jgi:2-(1,2-epoxy-1,2-dihydrophenyl)acetyl-CoA isomerase
MYKTVIYGKEDGVATLTLNRPDRFNAWDDHMTGEALAAVAEVAQDDEVRVLILTGAGKAFSAGADIGRLKGIVDNPSDPRWVLERVRRTPSVVHLAVRLRNMDKPVIAAVNGVAAGAGFGVALACDIRIAAEEARFSLIFVRRGLIPDCGSTYNLPRVVGMSRACEMAFTGDLMDAREAERIGLVSRVVKAEALMKVTRELAQRIASGPRVAVQLAKRALYRGAIETDLATQSDYELYLQSMCFQTEDFKEGVTSFLEKREPKFKGR